MLPRAGAAGEMIGHRHLAANWLAARLAWPAFSANLMVDHHALHRLAAK